jgi:hypothetical protein
MKFLILIAFFVIVDSAAIYNWICSKTSVIFNYQIRRPEATKEEVAKIEDNVENHIFSLEKESWSSESGNSSKSEIGYYG